MSMANPVLYWMEVVHLDDLSQQNDQRNKKKNTPAALISGWEIVTGEVPHRVSPVWQLGNTKNKLEEGYSR